MKISRIYLKIFLSFMLVLLVAELAIFGLMHMSWEKSPRINHMEHKILTIKSLAELELGKKHLSAEQEKKILTPLLETLGKSMQAQIWITDPYGKIVASSTTLVPDMIEYTSGEPALLPQGTYIYKNNDDRLNKAYGTYTAKLPEGYPFTYHMFHTFPNFDEESWFLRAQVILTIIAAIFLIPVSRRMIRPLKTLTESASKMGKGDLRQRVEIKGRDEVAELGLAFNSMAEGLERMVKSGKELTANVSHELRSPLARMRISLEMLRERIEDGNTSGCEVFINGMQFEISHMDELIGKIIEFSKLDMHKQPAMNETADMKSLIEDLVAQYQHIAEHNKLSLALRLDEIKIRNCHRNGLRIIMDNILSNAFKYTNPQGNIIVALHATAGKTVITVTNSHAPLPPEDLDEIFNPFHRLKGQETPGSGLGLASAQKITLMHNGEIRAENHEDGFRIIVELPEEIV